MMTHRQIDRQTHRLVTTDFWNYHEVLFYLYAGMLTEINVAESGALSRPLMHNWKYKSSLGMSQK